MAPFSHHGETDRQSYKVTKLQIDRVAKLKDKTHQVCAHEVRR